MGEGDLEHLKHLPNDAKVGLQNQALRKIVTNAIKIGLQSSSFRKTILTEVDKQNKKEETAFVLKCVAEKYNISIRNLIHGSAKRRLKDAKDIAYCLLHLEIGLSQRHIAQRIFFNFPTSIGNGVKRYKLVELNTSTDREFANTQSEREFRKSYNAIKEKLVQFISDKNK
jgi:hypothetical protein